MKGLFKPLGEGGSGDCLCVSYKIDVFQCIDGSSTVTQNPPSTHVVVHQS